MEEKKQAKMKNWEKEKEKKFQDIASNLPKVEMQAIQHSWLG